MFRTEERRDLLTGEDALMHELDATAEGFLDLEEFGEDEIEMLVAQPARPKTRAIAR